MIPPILHQTWRDTSIPPAFRAYAESWKRLHPDWQFKLWSDADLAAFVHSRYPALAPQFEAYPAPVMRADLGRYLILREFGGVYADLDAEAVACFDPLREAGLPIFAYEPASHASLEFVRRRGFQNIVSNAVILSPPGHPFWDHLLGLVSRCRHAANPLDATGPFVLTAACEQAGEGVRLLPAYLFSPRDKDGRPAGGSDPAAPGLAIHHWAGTWWKKPAPAPAPQAIWRRIAPVIGRWLSPVRAPRPRAAGPGVEAPGRQDFSVAFEDAERKALDFRGTIDLSGLVPVAAKGKHVLIAIPARDAAGTLDALTKRLLALRYPRATLSLAFIEGDSQDGTLERIETFAKAQAPAFRKISVLKRDTGLAAVPERWTPGWQHTRRAHLARIRNSLIADALDDCDWVLWIDADIIDFPDDVLDKLLAADARIVHPNAMRGAGAESMDLNAWIAERQLSPAQMAPHIIAGLYQPPKGFERLYLSDLRYRDEVLLDSTGGTMLLADADLHRAGLIFPETPYRFLIETEGFGAAARDLGIAVMGLPNVEIIHAAR